MKWSCSFLLLLASAGWAQDRAPAPADLTPDDAILYVELDAAALVKGLHQLDVTKVLGNAKYRKFFMPLFRKLELDPSDPAGSFVRNMKIQEWLKGRAAFAVRSFKIVPDDGKRKPLRPKEDGFSVERMVHGILAQTLKTFIARNERIAGPGRLELDFVAVIEPGPLLSAAVKGFLQNPPFELGRRVVAMGDRQLLHLTFPPFRIRRGLSYAPELYMDLGKDRWLMATNADVLAQMLADGPRRPLSKSEQFRATRARFTEGHRAVFGFLDATRTLAVCDKFLPVPAMDALRKRGKESLRGAGFGVSFVEGGVRESFGLVLDGQPKGLWRLLDAFPPGLRSIRIVPPNTGALIGFKFDLKTLVKRLKEEGDALKEGFGDELVKEFAEGFDELDFEKNVLPALGDEIGLMLFTPKAMWPEWVLWIDLRDEAAFRRILALEDDLKEIEIADGLKGWEMAVPFIGITLNLVIAKGHFFMASSRELARDAVQKWGSEGAKVLGRDNAAFARTMRGLNGDRRNELFALGFLNLQEAVPPLLGALGGGVEWNEVVDLDELPNPKALLQHFAGVAIGVRRDAHGVTLEYYSPVGTVWLSALLLGGSGAAPFIFELW